MQAAFDHVGLSVSDLGVATEWWCRALDLTVEYGVEPPGTDLTGVMLVHSSGYRVELLHRPGSFAFPPPTGPVEAAARRGYGHLCLRVVDVAAVFAALVQAARSPGRPLQGRRHGPVRPPLSSRTPTATSSSCSIGLPTPRGDRGRGVRPVPGA